MERELDGGNIIEAIYEILHQDGEKANDLECAYQILDYLERALK